MRISYNPLWKLLIDRNMKKKDLCDICELSTATVSKLTKGDNLTTDVLLKICTKLNCNLSDIVETLPDESK